MRKRSVRTVALAASMMMVIALAGCGPKSDDTSKLGLGKTGGSASSTSAASGSASQTPPSSANPKTTSGESGGATSSDGSGSGTSGGTGGASGTSGSSGSQPSSGASTKGMIIKIRWWNDTVDRAPRDPQIVFGGKTYRPDSGASDIGSIGPCPVGKDLELVVYPDGRDGAKLVAKFRITPNMVANSETDAIHVEVKDKGVRVLGNPIENFIQSFDRP